MSRKISILYLIIILTILPGCQKYDSINSSEGNSQIIPPYSTEGDFHITLYYPDRSLNKLIPKEISIENIKSNLEIEVLGKLFEGIDDPDIVNIIPSRTKLRSIEISDQIAYINLSKDIILENITQEEEVLILYSIVNTMTELDSINSVQILIDGEGREVLSQYYNIETPLKYSNLIVKENYVDPMDTIENYFKMVVNKDTNHIINIFEDMDRNNRIAYAIESIEQNIEKYNITSFVINNYRNSLLVDMEVEVIINEEVVLKNQVFSLIYSKDQNIFKISEIYE